MKTIKTYTKFNESKYNITDHLKAKTQDEINNYYKTINPDELLLTSIEDENFSGVDFALTNGADPSLDNNTAIRIAARRNNPEIIKRILQDERTDPSANRDQAIIWSARFGYIDCVKVFLDDERVDPSACANSAIYNAAKYRFYDVVKLLLEQPMVIDTLSKREFEYYTRISIQE